MSSQLVLGTVQWGLPYGIANRSGQPAQKQVEALLKLAADAGVDTLDTARGYGDSEAVIGALTEGDPRWRIVTKIAPLKGSADRRAAALESLALSRAALRRQRLDVVLLHDPADRLAADGAVWQLLGELRASGEIGAIGISAITPDDAMRALDEPSIEVIQVAASLLDQRLRRRGYFSRARELGKQTFVRSVFLQGVAHLDALPPFLSGLAAPLAHVRQWTRAHGCTVAELFLGYARDVLGGNVIVGCETVDQLAANLRAFRSPALPFEELAQAIPPLDDDLLDPSRWPRQS